GTFPAALCGKALLACELGRHDEARAIISPFAADGFGGIPRDSSWLPSMSMLSQACALLGEKEWAEELYECMRPYAGRLAVAGPPPLACIGLISHGLGLLAATQDQEEAAAAHFEDAIRQAEALDARPFLVQAQEAYGAALERFGQKDRADELF